jgi:hypothetical protein
MEPLRCQRLVLVEDGETTTGRKLHHHEPCPNFGQEVIIYGLLTSAKSILCEYHKKLAQQEAFVSSKGFTQNRRPRHPRHDDEPFLPFKRHA